MNTREKPRCGCNCGCPECEKTVSRWLDARDGLKEQDRKIAKLSAENERLKKDSARLAFIMSFDGTERDEFFCALLSTGKPWNWGESTEFILAMIDAALAAKGGSA